MKVLFNTFNPYTAQNVRKSNRNTSFCAQPAKAVNIGLTNLKRIVSEAEYDSVFNNLKSEGSWSGFWNYGNKFEQGLMPYIGKEDISYRINRYMLGFETNFNRYSTSAIEKIIRLMDYALKEVDKAYGKYEGLVYRYGRLDNTTRNFVSTARDSEGPVHVLDERNDKHSFRKPFHIIDVKNGHKVEEVQKKLKYNPVFAEESEILLDAGTKFEDVTEPTPQMLEAKDMLIKSLHKNHFYSTPQIFFHREI